MIKKALASLLIFTLTAGSFLYLVPTAFAAIAFDNSAQAVTSGNASSLTYSITVANTNPILIVKVDTVATITGVTFNGVAMTQACLATNILDVNTNVYVFYLKAPTSGANSIVITASTALHTMSSTAFSFTGALQTGTVDVGTPYYNTIAESGNITVTVNVTTPNSWMFAAQDSQAANPDTAINSIFGFTTGNPAFQDAYSNAPVGSGNQTIGYHWPSNDNHAICAIAFPPTVSPSSHAFLQITKGFIGLLRGMMIIQ